MLHLRKLTVKEKNGLYLPIQGIEPLGGIGYYTGYCADYENLKVLIPLTGRLRLARDFISTFYVHMGFQKATAFETVLDITLENGHIVEVTDRSAELDQKRGAFNQHYHSGDISIPDRINEAFSLDMDLE
ncbi:MAG: hypothetical protein WCP96_17490 [Methylococcaceae bacterium]